MTSPDVPETPEEEGIPDYADDTSTAYEETERPTFSDSPAALPADRPQAVDEHGVTGPEAREGEPLEQRLQREEPAEDADARWPGAGSELGEEVVTEQGETQVARDTEVLGVEPEPAPEPGPVAPEYEDVDTPGRRGLAAEEDAMHETSEDELSGEP